VWQWDVYDGTADEMADEIQMSCGNQNELGYFQQKYSPLLGSLEANPTVSISPHKRMKKYLFQNHLSCLCSQFSVPIFPDPLEPNRGVNN
jgi:hypothetical protein